MPLKGEGKRFLHGDLICTYTLSEYISDIYVDGLCIISVKLNFETGRDLTRDDVTGWKERSRIGKQWLVTSVLNYSKNVSGVHCVAP